jgi:hypothetical protein
MPKFFSAETPSDRVLSTQRSAGGGKSYSTYQGGAALRPGRHLSDARPFRSPCESPHRPPAARYPAAAPINWPPPTPPRVDP